MAEAEGKANSTLHKISHTRTADYKITNALQELSGIYEGIKVHKEKLNYLAGEQTTSEQVQNFLNLLFPVDDKKDRKQLNVTKQEEVKHIFNSKQEGLTEETVFSKYGLLNAVTDFIDHEQPKHGNDEASIIWDGIVGKRSEIKNKAVNLLLAV
jgi:hypothetical protein